MDRKLNTAEIFKLIDLYRSHPILWDSTSKMFRRKDLRTEAYNDIAFEMGMTVEFVQKKIHSIRSTYTGEIRKMNSGDEYVSHLCWFNEMTFLDSSIATRKYGESSKVCLNQTKVKHASINTKKHKKIAPLKEDAPSSSSKIYEYSSLETKNEDNRDNFYDINTQTMDSNDSRDSGSIASPSVIEVKPERVQEVHVKDCINELEHGTAFDDEIIDDNNAESTSTQQHTDQVLLPDNFVEPKVKKPKKKRGFSDPLNDSDDLLTERPKLVPRQKKKNEKPVSDDPLDESTSSSNDHFEQWAKKKIQLLEIELLEMRNYKFKLELYEKEQQLRLSCSKFTRDIRGN
ncbi:uncharacterized protein LOC135950904 [Calliphora vicina]|uniref:uncharacterized protein LOC135950904 n=1 Tax=Calliphora vicina TaxID=7373 RepID=UPI00325B7F42